MSGLLSEAFNIEDLRGLARRRLPRGVFDFVNGGSEDGVSLQANQRSFKNVHFLPRVLKDVSGRSARTTLFGREVAMPVVAAPTGAAALLWLDGEKEVALAAHGAGVPFVLSTASLTSMEVVADGLPGADLWFQLYMWPERRYSYELIDRAKAAGYRVLVVTVDTVVSPNREYNRRNGFSLPFKVTRRNIADMASHPRWLCSVMGRYLLRGGLPRFDNYPQELQRSMTGHAEKGKPRGLPLTDSLTWDDLKEIRSRWTGPLVVKGILHPDDAATAVSLGADGVVVSNHGGRNLDGAVPPLAMLPEMVEKIGHHAEVILDGGVHRGADVAKALCLGARAVLVGRAPLWGVSAGGRAGAQLSFSVLQQEMLRVLAFLGCRGVDELNRALVRCQDFPVRVQ